MLLTILLSSAAFSAPAPSENLLPPVPVSKLRELYGPTSPQEDASERAFNYNYADAGLSFGDGSGFILDGSYALDERFLAVASFSSLSDGPADLTQFSIGAGYVYPVNDKLDFVGTAELEYANIDLKIPFIGVTISDSEFGLRGRAGVRYAVIPQVEAYGGAEFRTVFNGDFVLDGGALYKFNDVFSGFAQLELGDLTQFSIGVRYSW